MAASDAEVAELRRALQDLQAQNRELARRLNALETEASEQRRRQAGPQRAARQPTSAPRTAAVPARAPEQAEVTPSQPGTAPAESRPRPRTSPEELEGRVRELEVAKAAQENATRSIIRDALSTLGSNINQYVALGGALEVRFGRFRDFTGPWHQSVQLNTAELDFDIKMNDWVYGSLITSYDRGTNVLFPTVEGFPQAVDRFNLDRATITVGDPQLFPLYFRGGRDVLSFGTSTGIARLDTLSLAGPLTTEAFETREDFLGFGFAFPTPELGPLPPPVVIPPVRPLVVSPLVKSAVQLLGYGQPLVPVQPLVAVRPLPTAPPIYGRINFFHGNREIAPNRAVTQNINASLGYFKRGSCGQPYEELRASWVCPWSFDFHVDYINSVFDSNFLRIAYRSFLPIIGTVPGMAAALKASFGPFSLVGEYNTAIGSANFVDGSGRRARIKPAAWQVALAYQFDWNPWVEQVGEQGSYVSIAYSGTKDLAGVTDVATGTPTRVGFLPQSRLALTAGEWVFPNLRLVTELSFDWDYAKRDGGTGGMGIGFFTSLLLTF
ncbi:MAG TPA: hypothetical protein VE684_16310 [Crenalkalicoccus sp.]|nr:hypothetical protein [Crenalkalicoccus sp.]